MVIHRMKELCQSLTDWDVFFQTNLSAREYSPFYGVSLRIVVGSKTAPGVGEPVTYTLDFDSNFTVN